MKAYKGFNKDMTCRGYQFEEGQTYEETEAKLCKSGFHACGKPLDVFAYYPPANSVYHEVELEDVDTTRNNDSKVCAKRIKIGVSLSIADLVKADVEYTLSKIDKTKVQEMTGYRSASTSTGDQSASTSTGNYSASTVTGKESVAASLGINGKSKGALGCWIICADWEERTDGWHRKDVQCTFVDGVSIKPDTFYTLKDGTFVEAPDDE